MTKLFRLTAAVLCLCLLMSAVPFARATEQGGAEAQNLSGVKLITDHVGFYHGYELFDGDTFSACYAGRNASLTLSDDRGIGSVYLIFDIEYGTYTITDNASGKTITCGETRLLHEFVDLEAAFGESPKSVTITFGEEELYLNELYAFSSGQVPDFVQRWELPRENETDLILFSTHGDDEQLFFAGVLPYYARELGYEVLVVYMTAHRNITRDRAHEMLNGLWAVGVTTYPILGDFPDFHIKSKEGAYSIFSNMGYTEEDITRYVVENIRRFKPKVAVGHDPLGEYSHGQHMVYSEVLQNAVQRSMDPNYFPESAEKYGVYDVPKTYLHLYTENQIYMDWDQPLESFDGMTAFEVTKNIGFPCHASQFVDFAWYMSYVDTAAEVPNYNPCEYGLFRSTVGADVEKNEFFENVLTYDQEKQKAAEEEAARLAAEAAAAEEATRLAEEARLQEEAERLAREEEARQEDRAAERAAAQRQKIMLIICCTAALLALLLLMLVIVMLKRRRY